MHWYVVVAVVQGGRVCGGVYHGWSGALMGTLFMRSAHSMAATAKARNRGRQQIKDVLEKQKDIISGIPEAHTVDIGRTDPHSVLVIQNNTNYYIGGSSGGQTSNPTTNVQVS